MFGKLSWSAIPFDQPIPLITSVVLIVTILGVLGLVTAKGWWPYLWREWITSVDHKRIGIMYCLLGVMMLIRGVIVGQYYDASRPNCRINCRRIPPVRAPAALFRLRAASPAWPARSEGERFSQAQGPPSP